MPQPIIMQACNGHILTTGPKGEKDVIYNTPLSDIDQENLIYANRSTMFNIHSVDRVWKLGNFMRIEVRGLKISISRRRVGNVEKVLRDAGKMEMVEGW